MLFHVIHINTDLLIFVERYYVRVYTYVLIIYELNLPLILFLERKKGVKSIKGIMRYSNMFKYAKIHLVSLCFVVHAIVL